jgi:hypothetical protein
LFHAFYSYAHGVCCGKAERGTENKDREELCHELVASYLVKYQIFIALALYNKRRRANMKPITPTELADILSRYLTLLRSAYVNEEMKTWFKKFKNCDISAEEFKALIEKAEKNCHEV